MTSIPDLYRTASRASLADLGRAPEPARHRLATRHVAHREHDTVAG